MEDDEFGALLNSEQLYRRDLEELIFFVDKKQIDALLEQTRKVHGDPSEILIFYCLPIILSYAVRLHDHRIPILELVGVGNLSLMETMERALAHTNPAGYLLRFAYGSMSHYRTRFQSIISVPSTPDAQPHKVLTILNDLDTDTFDIEEKLDMPIESEQDMSPLYRAVESLSPSRKSIIQRLLGMNGAPETVTEIAGGNSTTRAYDSVRVTKDRAQVCMRDYLKKHHPDFVRQHMREVTVRQGATERYIHVKIPEITLYKLEIAWQRLSSQDGKITAHKLRVHSGVHTKYAAAFFQLKMMKV